MIRRVFLLACLEAPAVPALAGIGKLNWGDSRASQKYVRTLQMDDGGFRASVRDVSSSLGSTSSCLRALKYFGTDTPRKDAVERYLWRCFDLNSGGFGDIPGARPDVRSTAMGVMCAAELKADLGSNWSQIGEYLTSQPQTRADIYIAAAAVASAGLPTTLGPRGISEWETARQPDGSYGTIADTAGAVITILRLGGVVQDRIGLLRLLRTAQKPDGGWGTGETSDLSTTYRVTRAIKMLQSRPDLGRLRSFIDRCRNGDGGYGLSPGQTSQAGPSYFASIVLHWAEEADRG